MKRLIFLFFFCLLLFNVSAFATEAENSKENMDVFYISGTILDSHKEPVKEAEITLFVNGKPHKIITDHKETEKTVTSSHGTFQLKFQLPKGEIDTAKIQIEIVKSSYKRTTVDFKKRGFCSQRK